MKYHPYSEFSTKNTKEEDYKEEEDNNLCEELVVLIYVIPRFIFLSPEKHLMHINTEFPNFI